MNCTCPEEWGWIITKSESDHRWYEAELAGDWEGAVVVADYSKPMPFCPRCGGGERGSDQGDGMKMLGRRVLVAEAKHADQIGLIHVPDRAKQRPQEGVVVLIGDEVDEEERIKVGDRVLFGRHAGIALTWKDKPYRLFWDRDLIAVLED